MANQSLNQLRAELKARQRAAGQKISRNTRQGIKLAGTEYDPRVPADRIDRYNSRQLRAQLNRVNTFTSRETQFVAVHNGEPLPRQRWAKYKATELAAASNMEATLAKFDSIELPGSDRGRPETVGERRARIQVKHRTAANPAVNVPDAPPARQPHHLKNADAAKKLTTALQKKTSSRWIEIATRKDKLEAAAMLDVINNQELKDAIFGTRNPDGTVKTKGLTSKQFYLLWNFTNFAENISSVYVSVNKQLEGDDADFDETVIGDNLKEAGDWVEWARTVKIRR